MSGVGICNFDFSFLHICESGHNPHILTSLALKSFILGVTIKQIICILVQLDDECRCRPCVPLTHEMCSLLELCCNCRIKEPPTWTSRPVPSAKNPKLHFVMPLTSFYQRSVHFRIELQIMIMYSVHCKRKRSSLLQYIVITFHIYVAVLQGCTELHPWNSVYRSEFHGSNSVQPCLALHSMQCIHAHHDLSCWMQLGRKEKSL